MSEITLRDVADADLPFVLDLYASVRDAEMQLVPWTPEQKRAFVEMQFAAQLRGYRDRYPSAEHLLILSDHNPAGRLYVDRGAKEIHILDITVAPARRGAGIGSTVLNALIAEAGLCGKPVSIYVEDFNPSLRLFEHLGFRLAKQDGFQLLLERAPNCNENEKSKALLR